MKRLRLALIAVPLALALPAAPAAAQNWSVTSAQTAAGGHRLGDPDAPLQIIEFVSYTCSHCADFERESEAELRYFYIQEARAALEVRPFIRNIVDIAATLVAECGEEDKFFGNHRLLLHRQDDWLTRAQEISPQQQARWNTGTVPTRMRAIAADLDFYNLMEPRGYSISQLNACLSDQARAEAVVAASGANAEQYNITGTPSFALSDTLLEGVHSWPALREVLSAARALPAQSGQ